MLSETEELLQSIPLTDHAQFCRYPCWCMTGPGTEAERAYLDNIRRMMITAQSVTVIEPRPRMLRFKPTCG